MKIKKILLCLILSIFIIGTSCAYVEAKIVTKDYKTSKYHYHTKYKYVYKSKVTVKGTTLRTLGNKIKSYCKNHYPKGWKYELYDIGYHKGIYKVWAKQKVKVKHYLIKHTEVSDKNINGMVNMEKGVVYYSYWCNKCDYCSPIYH